MVIIIGAGPIGLATGIELKKRNIPFLIIERGCLVQSLYNYPVNMTFFSTSDKLEIGGIPFISHGFKPTRSEALEYYRRAAQHYELPVQLYESVERVEGEDGQFTVHTSKGSYEANKIVIATGFYGTPNKLGVTGEDLPKVMHYYKEAHPFAWQKVLVVGAGNSGVDVALECYRSGAEVSMAIRYSEVKPTVKYWVKPDIENRIKNNEITTYFNTELVEIREHEVDLKTPEGQITIENDFVLAMTGYRPNYALLDRLGIEYSKDEACIPVYNEQHLESNRKGIYVAGVVCAGMQTSKLFIENSRVHADQIAHHIALSTV
jgi:thioredoxin reductase (NADPH)